MYVWGLLLHSAEGKQFSQFYIGKRKMALYIYEYYWLYFFLHQLHTKMITPFFSAAEKCTFSCSLGYTQAPYSTALSFPLQL